MPELRSRCRIPRPRSHHPLVRGLRAVWTAPTNAIGHLVGLLASGEPPRFVRSTVAVAWLYPAAPATWIGRWFDRFGAVTLGHAIVHRPDLFEGRVGRAVLAHELAHTRQHDVLGPVYLPAHALCQSLSVLLSLLVPGRVTSRVHAYNPLEHVFICLGAQACYDLVAGRHGDAAFQDQYLERFGV